MRRLAMMFVVSGAMIAASEIKITASDSLSLQQGVYASITFTARSSGRDAAPATYKFSESGHVPPGMIFERYPCNKPGFSPCPTLARADAIYLDGTPSAAGSYTVTVTASEPQGGKASQQFTITVAGSK